MKKAWVGRLRNLVAFDKLEEELMWGGGEETKPKYLGGDIVLLLGLDHVKAEDLCKEGVQSGLSMFHSLQKWSPKMCTGFRLVWIMCWGIPIHAWDMESIKKIAKSVDVVKIDEEVEDLQRLDRARVLVKTP